METKFPAGYLRCFMNRRKDLYRRNVEIYAIIFIIQALWSIAVCLSLGGMTSSTREGRASEGTNVNGFSTTISFSSPLHASSKVYKNILIILNTPISDSPNPCFEQLWKYSDERICADGGANRLYAYSKDYIPNRIRGDLDSLDPGVRAYYEEQKVIIEKDSCQDTNDLDKALQVCSKDDKQSCHVVVYGFFGGRFDQEMASFAALYKWSPTFQWQMYLYSDETCAFLIPANTPCQVRLPFYDTHNPEEDDTIQENIGEGPTCGLIPLGCRCESITTTGLKWDLDGNTPMEFGGLVSSSNRVMKPVVEITSSHPIIFTAELVMKKLK